ncbi:MAG: hypothetical protein GX779_07940 [Clostridia bacterium]|jgi:hypothetical protein|nr:hypothetical protein [Clostridia bacterium]
MANDLEKLLREFKVQNNQLEREGEALHVMPAGYSEGTEDAGAALGKSGGKVFRKKALFCLALLFLAFWLFLDT